jgi:hypothetical protein
MEGAVMEKIIEKIILTKKEYQECRTEGDGVCTLCFAWTLSSAEPLAEGKFCPECSNSTLIGVDVAVKFGLVEVAG